MVLGIQLVLLFCFLFIGGFPVPTQQAQQQSLVLIGGDLLEGNFQVIDRIISLSGGKGNALIGIITADSIPQDWDRQQYNPNNADNSYGKAD